MHQHFVSQFPFTYVGNSINALPEIDAYVELQSMEVLGNFYIPATGIGNQVPIITLDKITRDPQIRIENHRVMRPFVLAGDENLAEPTFYSFFPNNVLAVMRNGQASPTTSSIRDYVNHLQLRGVPEIDVIPLVDRERLATFADMAKVKKFTFAVGSQVNASVFNDSISIKKIIADVRQNLGFVEIEMTIKASDGSENQTSENVKSLIGGLLNNSEAMDSLGKAQVSYVSEESGTTQVFDFLSEMIVMQIELETDDRRLPSIEAVAKEMKHSYTAMTAQIQEAVEGMIN